MCFDAHAHTVNNRVCDECHALPIFMYSQTIVMHVRCQVQGCRLAHSPPDDEEGDCAYLLLYDALPLAFARGCHDLLLQRRRLSNDDGRFGRRECTVSVFFGRLWLTLAGDGHVFIVGRVLDRLMARWQEFRHHCQLSTCDSEDVCQNNPVPSHHAGITLGTNRGSNCTVLWMLFVAICTTSAIVPLLMTPRALPRNAQRWHAFLT